jgi:small-conductance mechanosensitive channel
MSADVSTPLIKKLFATKEEWIDALNTSGFYLELMLVALAFVIAGLTAFIISKRTRMFLEAHPPKRFDVASLMRPFALLPSILSLLFLAVVRPFIEQYAQGGEFAVAAARLVVAYIMAKAILLMVRSRLVAWFIAFVVMVIAVLDVTGFMATTKQYLEAMSFEAGKFKITVLNLVNGLIILVVVFWVAGVLSRSLESYLHRASTLTYNTRELIVKFFRIFVYFIALLITLSAIGVDLTAFAVFGGALGVGIGLGLQKLTANFVSGITLLVEKSIKLGDLIEVGGVTGWVRALNIRYALVESSDGRELMIPNEQLVSTQVTNWTHSNEQARVEIRLALDVKADARRAMAIMLECASAHPRSLKAPKPLCWLREFNDAGMLFVLTFWIGDIHEGRNGPQSDVMLAILDEFRAAGIEFGQALKA